MTDDPLAHLYGTVDDDLEEPRTVASLEELVSYAETLEEELTDEDLDELALLVKAKLDEGGLPDEEAAALGLGEILEVPGADFDHELVLNDVGRAVMVRVLEGLR